MSAGLVSGRQLMEWVDLGLKRSDEYREGQAVIVPERFPRSSDPKLGTRTGMAHRLRLAATIWIASFWVFPLTKLRVKGLNDPFQSVSIEQDRLQGRFKEVIPDLFQYFR